MLKINKSEKVSKKNARAFIASVCISLAITCGLSGCNFFKNIDKDIDTDDLTPDHSIEQVDEDDHQHKEEDDFFVVDDEKNPEEDEEQNNPAVEDDEKNQDPVEDENKFVIPNIGDYDGVSIADALRLAGYENSFEFRKTLAEYFGIDNYTGTHEQNAYLLNLLKDYAKEVNKENGGGEHTTPIGEHRHVYVKKNVVYVNLNDDSHTERVESECATCGDKQVKSVTVSHSYSDWIDKEDGTESRSCGVCGYTMTHQKEVKHEHKFVEGTPVYTNINGNSHDEMIVSECECGETKTNIKRVPHTFGAWKVSEDLKTETSSCLECGYTKTRNREVVPHTHHYEESAPSFTNVSEATHDVTVISTCKDCGDVKVLTKRVPHTFGAWKVSEDLKTETSSCLDCGYTKTKNKEVAPHTHHYVDTSVSYSNKTSSNHDQTTVSKCSECGDIKVNTKTLSHTYGPWVSNGDGTESRTCGDCGYTATRNISRPPVHHHQYVDETTTYTNKNDETHDSVTVSKCSCGDTKTKIKTSKHTYGAWLPSEDLKTETRKCSECGYTMTRNKELPPHEHSYVDGAPTYSNKTEDSHTKTIVSECSCGNKKTTVITEGHKLGALQTAEDGSKYQVCSDCGYQKVHKHTFVNQTPTYEDKNNDSHTKVINGTCACGEEKVVSKTKEAHKVSTWTPSADGTKETGTCSECGYTVTKNKELPPHEHSYVDGTPIYSDKTDDTHRKTIVSECSCGDKKTSSVVEAHKISVWTPSADGTKETGTCSDCGYVVTRNKELPPHQHSFTELVGTSYENITDTGHDKVLTYKCSGCSEKDKKVIHESHGFGSYVSKDDQNEEASCACGKTSQRGHSYGIWQDNGSSDSRECSTCSHVETKGHRGVKSTTGTYEKTGDDNYHYTAEVESCGDCGKELSRIETPVPHTYDSYKNNGSTHTTTCSACQHEKTENHDMKFSNIIPNSASQMENDKDNHNVREKYDCVCGATDTKTGVEGHHFGDWTSPSNGYHTHACSDCCYIVEEKIECSHENATTVYDIDKKQNKTTCNDCGLITYSEHTDHKYEWKYDSSGEINSCSICGDVKENKNHTGLDTVYSTTYRNDGESGHTIIETHKCSNDGCTYSYDDEKTMPHSLDGYEENHDHQTDTVCWTSYRYCTDGDCGYQETPHEEPHVYGEYSRKDRGFVCSKCGHIARTTTNPYDDVSINETNQLEQLENNRIIPVGGPNPDDEETIEITVSAEENENIINLPVQDVENSDIIDSDNDDSKQDDGQYDDNTGEEVAVDDSEAVTAQQRVDEIEEQIAALEQAKKDLEAIRESETEEPVLDVNKELIKE